MMVMNGKPDGTKASTKLWRRSCLFMYCMSVLLCITQVGCGESEREKVLRENAEARAKAVALQKAAREEDERRRVEAEKKRAEDEAREKKRVEEEARQEAERKKAQEEAERKAEAERRKMEEESRKQEEAIKAYLAEIERKKPRSVYTLSPEERSRFNKIGGFVLGETWNGVPDADPRDPTPFIRKVRMDKAFDVFSEAEAEIVYTPVSKKAACIKVVVEKSAAKYDQSEDERILNAFKKHYDVEFCFFDRAKYVIRGTDQAWYDSTEGVCSPKEEVTYGYNNAVDDKVLSINYEFDTKKNVARYTFYAINTNLYNAINVEAIDIQEKSIESEIKNSSRTLSSFCGVAFEARPDVKGEWGEGEHIKKITEYSVNREEEVSWTGANAPRLTVKCNQFRRFRHDAKVHVSPKSKTVFSVVIESDNLKTDDLECRGLWDVEFTNILFTIESKYNVKPYKLVYGNKYRRMHARGLEHKERLFVCGDTLIYLHDMNFHGKQFGLTCVDVRKTTIAVDEYVALRQEMSGADADVLFGDYKQGARLTDFYGIRLGQVVAKDTCESIARNVRSHSVAAYISDKVCKRFRGVNGIQKVKATWKTHRIYSVKIESYGSGSWGSFSAKEEVANINAILTRKLGIKPIIAKTEDGQKFTYEAGEGVVVEFSVGHELSIEAKDLKLEKLSEAEFEAENRKQDANRIDGASAL